MSQMMHVFEGFLDRVDRNGSAVSFRVVSGDFDPSPQTPPVLLITVEAPVEVEVLHAELLRVKEIDDGCYLAVLSGTEATLTTDHGNEIRLLGDSVTAKEDQYDERDFERLAKQNHMWGMSQHKVFTNQAMHMQRARQLLQEQHSRLSIKIQGHEPGTTAHTLYAQHLSFLSRVLAEFEA